MTWKTVMDTMENVRLFKEAFNRPRCSRTGMHQFEGVGTGDAPCMFCGKPYNQIFSDSWPPKSAL